MQEYLNFARQLALKAGVMIRSSFTQDNLVRTKQDGSPVTAIDQGINSLVITEIRARYPNHSIIGEEQSSVIVNSEYTWICDPLDGTVAFTHGMPTCAFSLALLQHGVPILGVTYDPFLNRLFTGFEGKSEMNTVPIKVSHTATLIDAVIGMPSFRKSVFNSPALFHTLESSVAFVLNTCAIAYMGSLVALGKLDGAVYLESYAHDIAAVKVLVEAAGGVVTDLWGNDQSYTGNVRGGIISNGFIHAELVLIIKKAGVVPAFT